uniref:Uncharacterized protein n=1 Tax=Caenorhabditis japonica TaxID=281687 RepID=A0A8R1IXZ9_CAEJA
MRTRDSAHFFMRDRANTVIFEEMQTGSARISGRSLAFSGAAPNPKRPNPKWYESAPRPNPNRPNTKCPNRKCYESELVLIVTARINNARISNGTNPKWYESETPDSEVVRIRSDTK